MVLIRHPLSSHTPRHPLISRSRSDSNIFLKSPPILCEQCSHAHRVVSMKNGDGGHGSVLAGAAANHSKARERALRMDRACNATDRHFREYCRCGNPFSSKRNRNCARRPGTSWPQRSSFHRSGCVAFIA